jgi:opacity protein-like surface antigen
MRRLLLAAAMCGAMSGAQAADMPDFLRGSFTGVQGARVNWQGYYFGGQAAYGSSNENFNGSNSSMIAALLDHNVIQQMDVANWNLGFGKQNSHSSGYGAFFGYNSQWDDVVLGLEASYLHGTFGGTATASKGLVGGPLSDNMFHAVTVTSSSAITISDMATFRGRAGYAYGSFLPYLFGGLALGNADITRSVTINDNYAPTLIGALSACPTPVCVTSNATQDQPNHLIYGYSAGLGVDINLVCGLFMRAEWEYVRFTSQVDTSINTVRAGLGYKF